MTSSVFFARVRRHGRLLLASLALVGLSAGLAGEALAQCQLVTGPTGLACPGCELAYTQTILANPGWVGLYRNSGGDRLLVPMTWGSIVYSLASPAFPSQIAVYDIRRAPGGPGFPQRDGQSFGNGYGISSDGQRALNSFHMSVAETVVSVPSGDTFLPKGDTGLLDANSGLVVQIKGNRYIAYGLGTQGKFFAVDITTLTSFDVAHPIPFEMPTLFSTSAQSLALAEGGSPLKQYLYGYDGAGVSVVDISTPGPAGSITSGFTARSFPTSAFNLPGQTFLSVSAVVDPATGKLYVLGAFWNGSRVPSFSLVLYDPATFQATPVGTFSSPDSSFSAAAGQNVGTLGVNPTTGDVMAFMWFGGSGASAGRSRLYATSAKTFGSPIGQWAEIGGTIGSLSGTKILFKSGTDTYAYFFDGATPWAMQMSCQAGPASAAGHLSVSNTSTGGTSLSSGDTVFVGDDLLVSPSVTPSSVVQTVTAWNLDFDYHAATETGTGPFNTQLLNPDQCLSGCTSTSPPGVPNPSYPDPPQFHLVGPCDPRTLGNPATGGGCWNSVGPSPGNGDFSSSQPAAGTPKTLPIAFEASNALNATTVPLATFNIVWKVPAVKVLNLSAILSSGSAMFTDGSEGHPVAAGYKWYFGTDNTAPSVETLNQDTTGTGCISGASCNHTFAAGKGTYNAWLVASYKGGYSSPDWSSSPTGCGGGPCAFKVTVTDFVAAFTAPSSGIINTNLTISNNSQVGGGLTGISYSYYLCDASSGSCPDVQGSYSPLNFSGSQATITAPGTGGTYWLRIRANYTSSSAQTAQWLPIGGLGIGGTAWPIAVTTQPPSIYPTAGFGYCTSGGCPSGYTGTAGTALTVGVFLGSTQQTGSFSWSVTGASSASGAGSTFTFTPSTAGTIYVAVTSGISPLPASLPMAIAPGTPPPQTLGVTVSASNYNPTTGVWITLTANPSGGTGIYSTYDWYITDGTSASSGFSSISHSFSLTGSYTVTCTVHSGGATASGSTTINVQGASAPNTLLPTAGYGNCTIGGCSSPYTGTVGTPITVKVDQGGTQQFGSYNWTVTGVSATPSSLSGFSTITFTPTSGGTATVTNTTLGIFLRITIPAPPTTLVPTAGCNQAGCPTPYAGTVGTAITVGVFQGSTQQFGSYNWTVTGVNATPASVSGFGTITFTPTTAGTATITNTTLSVSVTIAISGPTLLPTAGYGTCNLAGCPSQYTGTVGTPITVKVDQGGTQQFGSYDWTVSGVNATPTSVSGFGTITFTPTSGGTATVTNTTLSITLNIFIPAPPSVLTPTAGCSLPGCPVPYTGTVGTPITVGVFSGTAQQFGSYSWTVTGASATPASVSGFSTITFTPTTSGTATVTNTTLSLSVSITIPAPSNTLVPTAGYGTCTSGCPTGIQYNGATGTPITVGVFRGSTQQMGSYSWTVTGAGVNPSPSSGTGSTFTFTPLGPGTATVTNTTLSVSVSILIGGAAILPDFAVSDAVRGNIVPGSDGSFLVVTGRTTTFTGVVKGTTTTLPGTVNWNFGDGGTSTSNPANKTYSTPGAYTVTLTYAGQTVTHTVFPVAGIPTGGYSFNPADGGTLDASHVETGRVILFQATENYAASYSWNFNDGTPAVSGPSASHSFASPGSYLLVLTETLGANTFTTALPTTFVAVPKPNLVLPTSGASACTAGGCTAPYSGTTGTPITVGVFQGSTPQTGSYAWTVTGAGINPYPSSGTGSTFTFVPLGPGTATVTNTTLSVSVNILVGGIAIVPEFTVSDAVRGNVAPGSDGSFFVVTGRSTTFTGVVKGTATPLPGTVSWSFGDGGTSTSNPAVKTYPSAGAYLVTLTFAGQNAQHIVLPVPGVPTGGYTFSPVDGGTLDTSHVETNRAIQFQATENYAASYTWNFNDGTPAVSGPSVSHSFAALGSYTVVLTETLGVNTYTTALPTTFVVAPKPIQLNPTAGFGYCTFAGCSVPYTGTTGTPITVAAFQGTTPLTGTYSWTVTGAGINPNPSSGTGSTFTFTPLGSGTATVTNTTLSVSVNILVGGVAILPEFTFSDAVRGNIVPGSDGSFLVVTGRSTTFTGVVKGTATPLPGSVSWSFGDGGTSNSNPANKTYSTLGAYAVTLTFAGQTVQHGHWVVAGIPTGGYSFYPADGGTLDTNHIETGRVLQFQATENYAASYTWNFNDGTPTVSGGAEVRNVTHSFAASGSYMVVLTETLGSNTFTTALPTTFVVALRPNQVLPTSGASACTGSCTAPYTGMAGTPITVGVFQGSTPQTGSYSWTVTGAGINPYPSSGTGSTFTFLPLGPGTATVTNTTLSVSVNILVGGIAIVPDFTVSDAVRGNVAPVSDGSFLVVTGRTTTFTGVVKGTTTPLPGTVSWSFGDGGSSNSNPANKTYSILGAYVVVLSFAGQTVTRSVLPVPGIPTGGYSFSPADGGALDTSHVETGRAIQFQANENYAASYTWNFNDGTPAVSGPNVSHSFAAPGSYTVVLTETLGANTFTTALPATFVVVPKPYQLLPTFGASACASGGCTAPYTGMLGTPITVGVFQGSTQLVSGTVSWQVTSGVSSPMSGSDPTFAFVPMSLGPLVVSATVNGQATSPLTILIGAGPQSADLSQGRVHVTLEWRNPYSGETGTAYAIPQQDAFAFFYYADPNNPEVFVKVLDFGAGSALCFVGGLTDFYYKATFTMTRTGQTLVFEKPPYQYVGYVDTTSLKFAGAPGAPEASLAAAGGLTFVGALSTGETTSVRKPAPVETAKSGMAEPLAAATQSLLLSSGRVAVTVAWRNPYSGETGQAYGILKADQYGFFYYTDPNDPEVFVKVLDFGGGTALCFAGGLTDFSYKVTFTVLRTGQQLVFEKPEKTYVGFVDATTLRF